MKELRVAVFNTQPPHLFVGGVERRIIEIARELQNTVNTTVYSGTKNGFKKPASRTGMNLVPCFSTDRYYTIDNWVFNRTLSRNFNNIKADVYESHNISGYCFLRKLKKQNSASRLIQTIHGPLMDEYIQAKLNEPQTSRDWVSNKVLLYFSKIEHELARDSGLIVTVSAYSQNKIVEYYGTPPEKIRIVPNGVDCTKFRPKEGPVELKQKMKIQGKQCVLFVGRLVTRKGLTFLVEAAQQITKEYRDVMFVLVGGGPLRNSLTKQMKEKGVLDHFTFLGDVWGDVIPKLYNCSDIFALPSIQEGQGIVLLEAQASAKPVVSFNVSAIKEVVKNGETGLLVKPDSQKLADAILRLLSDEGLREKMGQAGREFVSKNFSWGVCAEKMLQVYKEVAS